MVRSALVIWLALAPALARAQTVAHSIPAKQSPAHKACVKAWDPESEKSLRDVTKFYWTLKCDKGMMPKQILEEAKNAPQTGMLHALNFELLKGYFTLATI